MTPVKTHKKQILELLKVSEAKPTMVRLVDAPISAGFPSPAMDFEQDSIDLGKFLIKRPSSTFIARVKGNSMKDLEIYDKDILIVDKSQAPQNGSIAVCVLDGEFTLKRIKLDKENDCVWLCPANDEYEPIKVTKDNELVIWGIVQFNIRKR
jgi:DNA polymerase V